MMLNHLALPERWLFGGSCDAPCAGGLYVIGGGELAAHVELDFARQLDDFFRVMAILEWGVFERWRAFDERPAIKTVLFLDDPVAALVLANEDDCRCRTKRWRFDEL